MPKRDHLLGCERAAGQTPLEIATMADMGAEIGLREWGQPGVLIYQHAPGVWPVRIGPKTETAQIRKMAKILMSVAEQLRELEAGRGDDFDVITPWGLLRRVRNWSGKRDAVWQERLLEIRELRERWPPAVYGWIGFLLGAALSAAICLCF